MANVQGLLSARFVDAYGISATTDAFILVDDTKTVAQLMTDAATWKTDTQFLSQGDVNEYSVRLIVTPSPSAGAGDIEKGALFNLDNGTDPYAQGYWIPAVNPDILNGSGLIDLSNTHVTDWITFMTTAHTAITVVTKGVRALTALRDALISFRKKRKPLSRKTKEVPS